VKGGSETIKTEETPKTPTETKEGKNGETMRKTLKKLIH